MSSSAIRNPRSAIVFDFDGLILETETPVWTSWRRIYQEHGHDVPLADWVACLGRGSDYSDFHGKLERLTGRTFDRDELKQRRRAMIDRELTGRGPLPGVVELIEELVARRIDRAVCSGSGRGWVEGHLTTLGLRDRFEHLVTGEDTPRHKPDPDPFLLTAARLGIEPGRCVVLEDSTNGVTAAKAAGMIAVAVPTPMTADLDFAHADLRLDSLAGVGVDRLLGLMSR